MQNMKKGNWVTWAPRNPMLSAVTGEILAIDGNTVALLPVEGKVQHRNLNAGTLTETVTPSGI